MLPKEVDKTKYETKSLNRVNGMPWPRIGTKDIKGSIEIPLKKEYLYRSMDYLDTPEARPIFDVQRDIIIKNKFKGIVDVGCRIGIVNDYLYEDGYTDYEYMGFDTSPQPIAYAQERWEDCENIEYRVADILDQSSIGVNFKVDCIIWSGILLYFSDNHLKIFNDTHRFYNALNAIIQEPCKIQDKDKWFDNMQLNTIETELENYKEKFDCKVDITVNCNIFSGKRRIIHLCL